MKKNQLVKIIELLSKHSFVKVKTNSSVWIISFNQNLKFQVTRLTNGIEYSKEYDYSTDFLIRLLNIVRNKNLVICY